MDQNPASANPAVPEPTAPASGTSAADIAASDVIVAPDVSAPDSVASNSNAPTSPSATPDGATPTTAEGSAAQPVPKIFTEVSEKIVEAQNVLVALSSDPSVDEMAAAIGLSLFLDKLGKRATAIYSGTTPNALEFLKPSETFESTADTLQDFVIALNKDKADHLRYKLDGDFVKIFITPYKTRISQEDLEFSYGDFNVDLVLALDVANGVDLDAALREHGRIMHDAVIINITTGNPGKLGEIEWSDKTSSSVSEMVAKLLYAVDIGQVEKDEATAFLTGIVAATNRFSNAKTTPETMQVSSQLMRSGANQQLVSKNITPDTDNELLTTLDTGKKPATANSDSATAATPATSAETTPESESASEPSAADAEPAPSEDPTKLNIAHDGPTIEDDKKGTTETASDSSSETSPEPASEPAPAPEAVSEVEPVSNSEPTPEPTSESSSSTTSDSSSSLASDSASAASSSDTESSLLDDLKAAEASLSQTGSETVPDTSDQPVKLEDLKDDALSSTSSSAPSSDASSSSSSASDTSSSSQFLESDQAPDPSSEGFIDNTPEKVIQPPSSMDTLSTPSADFGQMLEDSLSKAGVSVAAPTAIISPTEPSAAPASGTPAATLSSPAATNPASAMAPPVATKPEINGVPEINYTPAAGTEILPPPPTPPIDLGAGTLTPPSPDSIPNSLSASEPSSAPTPSAAPAASPQPQSSDPAAFKIPGL